MPGSPLFSRSQQHGCCGRSTGWRSTATISRRQGATTTKAVFSPSQKQGQRQEARRRESVLLDWWRGNWARKSPEGHSTEVPEASEAAPALDHQRNSTKPKELLQPFQHGVPISRSQRKPRQLCWIQDRRPDAAGHSPTCRGIGTHQTLETQPVVSSIIMSDNLFIHHRSI